MLAEVLVERILSRREGQVADPERRRGLADLVTERLGARVRLLASRGRVVNLDLAALDFERLLGGIIEDLDSLGLVLKLDITDSARTASLTICKGRGGVLAYEKVSELSRRRRNAPVTRRAETSLPNWEKWASNAAASIDQGTLPIQRVAHSGELESTILCFFAAGSEAVSALRLASDRTASQSQRLSSAEAP